MDKKILTLKDLKSSDYLSVDFYLSKSCNKSCHYCTAWTLEMRNLHVDMDFLRRTVEYLSPYKTRICLLGGEPGLIKNLDEVIAEIKKHPNLVVQVMSNSFVRKRYPQVLEDPEIIYIEHLVLDFYEDRIEKLGNFDFLPENDKNNYNLIIETPGYFKYKDQHDLSYIMHKNTEFKEYNSRSPDYHSDHFVEQAPELDRRICAKFPLVPVVDFELQKIRHCSRKVIDGSRQFDVTKENVDKMMTFDLFQFENYCRTCMDIIPNRPKQRKLQILEKIALEESNP
jgi:organic radical activating enzyme|tara:strand:- start:1985 stop:2833 length:849 start_codon:yes stop_codon:yes gene_type:complete